MIILLKHTIQKPNIFSWATEVWKAMFQILQKVFQNKFNLSDVIKHFASFRDKKKSAEVKRKRTEQSILVPFKEIKANDWDLSINRYKEIVYERVEYDAFSEIIERIKELSGERIELMSKLNSI